MVYINGSQKIYSKFEPMGTRAGGVLNWVSSWYKKQEILLGRTNKVYNSKVITILEGLKQVLKSSIAQVAPGIRICLDNFWVICNKSYISKSSSQKIFRRFKNLAENWLQTGKELTFQFIFGHTRIEGNKLAGQEGKKYTKVPVAAECD